MAIAFGVLRMAVNVFTSVVSFNNVSFNLQVDPLVASLDKFFEVESCGIQAPVLLPDATKDEEMALIESGLRYDENNKVWVTSYPWVKDPGLYLIISRLFWEGSNLQRRHCYPMMSTRRRISAKWRTW